MYKNATFKCQCTHYILNSIFFKFISQTIVFMDIFDFCYIN